MVWTFRLGKCFWFSRECDGEILNSFKNIKEHIVSNALGLWLPGTCAPAPDKGEQDHA